MNMALNNPHFQRVTIELLQCAEQKEKMEEHFTLDIVDEYSSIKQKMVELVAELLKADIEYKIAEDILVVELQGREISVALKQLRQFMGDAEYDFFFSCPEPVKEIPMASSLELPAIIMLMNSIQSEKAMLSEENRQLKQKNRELQESLQKISQKEDSLDKQYQQKISDLIEEYSALLKENQVLNEKTVDLQRELAVAKANTKSAASEEFSQKIDSLNAKIEALNKESEQLAYLAYYDVKTKVKNANAFNRDFHLADAKRTIYVMVSICKMRLINEAFGRSNGDNAIFQVAQELSSLFSPDTVYRVMGDKFTVLVSTENSFNDVYSAVSNLKKKLESMKIEIVFGVASGFQCQDKGEMIHEAEKMLNEMKNSSSSSNKIHWKTDEVEKETPVKKTTELSAEELMEQYLNLND